jgi:hypothetical protein
VKSDEDAYTSPSTAENQKVSEKVYANAPTAPAPNRAMPFQVVSGCTSFFANAVIVQKRKRIVNALASAERAFTHIATCDVSDAKRLKKWPISMKNGAPGGCPTSSFQALEMNSPQSQNEAVGSIVRRYVAAAIAKTIHPQSVFHNLKCFIFMLFLVFRPFYGNLGAKVRKILES